MEELTTGVVFRLATIRHTFPSDSEKLHVAHLELSENDKRQAADRGLPPLLSVFDALRTTVAQGEAIRGVAEDSLAFGLKVRAIRSVKVVGMRQPLRVVRDPLDPPLSLYLGAEGHCGIEGLDRRTGEDRKIYKEIRVRLADLSFRYSDEDTPWNLSVVIPCLNAEATLGAQLEALAGQSWEGEWEVIVADNGSTDGSRALVERFRGRLPGLRLADASDRRGHAHARNVGAAAATGDALLFVDADDQVAPGWLAAMGRALAEHEFVACRYDNEALNPAWVQRTHLNPQKDGITRYDYPAFLPHAGGGGLGVLRRVHEEAGGFDESMPALEDTDYCWRIQLAGHELAFAPEAVVRIRHRHELGSIFRQGMSYGRNNVLIYKRYRSRGMPRLGWTPGLLRWAKLLLKTPILLLTREGRARWLWQLGWRLGRLEGCWKYKVLAP